jgi:hypothetical protein
MESPTKKKIIIISHQDEVICCMLTFDLKKLIKLIQSDPIVNTVSFLNQSRIVDNKCVLEFKINGNNTLRLDMTISEIIE